MTVVSMPRLLDGLDRGKNAAHGNNVHDGQSFATQTFTGRSRSRIMR